MLKDILKDFASPPVQMRGAPFWAWNGKLEKERLQKGIRIMHEMGFGGFFMHSRTGLDTEYLGEEWFNAVETCIREAQKLGMQAYLYDEDRWPSGAAGGFVTSDDRYKMRKLYCQEGNMPEGAFYLCSFALTLKGDILENMRRIPEEEIPGKDERKFCFFWKYMDCTSWYNYATYLDTMNPEAVDRFTEVTHEQYFQRYKEHFSGTIPAMFTDEPCYIHGDVNGCLPWTADLCGKFRENFGYDLLDFIPELFFTTRSEITRARHDYYDLIAGFFAENFIGRIAHWGEKHSLGLCGHLLGEDALSAQTLYIGSAMRCYEKMQIPGVDVLTEYWNIFNTVKQCASVAAQCGKKLRMSETYGCTGWDFPLYGHKALGDWQYALGINCRCLHLTWYSMAGEGKRDYPASFCQHSPWYKKYSLLEEHFSRLGAVLKEGREIRDLLLIHPIESLWGVMVKDIPKDQANEANRQIQPGRKVLDTFDSPLVNELDKNHTLLTNLLLAENLDFDFGDEEMLGRLAQSEGKIFKVGETSYKQILIPELKTIRSSTLEKLSSFKGRIFYLGNPPAFVDALPSEKAAKVFASFTPVSWENLASVISSDFRRVSIKDDASSLEAQAVFSRLADCGDAYSFFIVNTSMEFGSDQKKGTKVSERNIVYRNLTVRLSLPFRGDLALFNTLDGTYKKIPYRYEKEHYIFQTSLEKLESKLFVIAEALPECEFKEESYSALSADFHSAQKIKALDNCGFSYTLSEENILVLDHAKWQTDDFTGDKAEYILTLDDHLRSMIGEAPRGGLMEQPWHRKRKTPEKSMALTLTYTFFCEKVPLEDCLLSMEEPEKFTIYINGKKLEQRICGFYLDEAIKNLVLDKTLFVSGENQIRLACEKYDRFTNLEALYIRGKFGVDENSCMTALPEKLFFGDWCKQKLANYAGNVIYDMVTDVPAPAKLVFPHWQGTLLGVSIDGKEEKSLAFFPFEIFIEPGRHTIEITVYGHRRNALGPFYLKEKYPQRTGPYQFKLYEQAERQLVPVGLLEAPELVFL